MKLQTKLWLGMVVAYLVVAAGAEFFIYRRLHDTARAELVEDARALRALLAANQTVYQKLFLESGGHLDERAVGFLPAHGVSEISEAFSRLSSLGGHINNVTDRARDPRNQADPLELAAMAYFRAHPQAREYQAMQRDSQGREYFQYATPILVEAYCLACHGDPAAAPEHIRRRYAGGFGYREGELRAITSIQLPAQLASDHALELWRDNLVLHLASLGLAFLVGGGLFHGLVLRRLGGYRETARRLSAGDYAARTTAPGDDEVGVLGHALNDMAAGIQARDRALRDGERRFRALFQQNVLGIAMLAPDGTFRRVNDRLCALCGHAASELLNQRLQDITHPEDLPLSAQDFQRMLAGEIDSYIREERCRRGDRGWMWVNHSGTLVRAEDGRPESILVTLEDISQRKWAESALRDEEERVRLLLDSTAEAIYGIDTEGHCMFVNRACLRALGYDRPEDLLGRPMHELMHHSHPDGRPYPAHTCRAASAHLTGQPVHVADEWFWRRDGRGFPVEYWAHPILKGDAHIGAVVAFLDISERRRSEERLRQAAAVFENTQEGVMVTDLDCRIVAVNRAFTEITGYSEADILGLKPQTIKSGHHDRAYYQGMWASILETGRWQGEIWNRRKNGQLYPQLLAISTVRDTQGQATHYVGVFSDISLIKRSEEQIERLAHYDALTGLPNRLLLVSRLAHAMEMAKRRGGRLAMLYIDLDRFKQVNDSLGHTAGDELLKAVTVRVQARLRDEDTLARLGADEFGMLLESIPQADAAAQVAQALIELLRAPFHLSGGDDIYIGASIGIALFPEDGRTAEALLRNADTAMTQAKQQGRNLYRFYNEGLTQAAHQKLALEAQLRRALEQGDFELHYQPQVAVVEGDIRGAEALVRWRHPGEGLIPPGRFIPLAEETGLIVPLGEWVLAEACRQAQAWRRQGLPPLVMAVNLSGRQFQDPALLDKIAAILRDTGLPPEYLELELTESVLMEQGERAVDILEGLKRLGVQIALDDFGTGYSSLAYLKRFHLDKLKIDQSFIRDLPEDGSDAQIVATIIAMARGLNLKVLAEGVETDAQLDFLRRHGCDDFQGYLRSRPVPAQDFSGPPPQST